MRAGGNESGGGGVTPPSRLGIAHLLQVPCGTVPQTLEDVGSLEIQFIIGSATSGKQST